MKPAERAGTAVLIAETTSEPAAHEAGRVARLHPSVPVFALAQTGATTAEVIFDRLQPFRSALLVNGEVPEDIWTRVARHWHECFRLQYPAQTGDPRAVARVPWEELDGFYRQDNVLQLSSIMAKVVDRGRRWIPARAVPPGSVIELTRHDLEEIARQEHVRWATRRLDYGWSADGPSSSALINWRVVPWEKLSAADQQRSIGELESQLARLEDVGFVPVIPRGGPPEAASFERIGTVRASQLQVRWPWAGRHGALLAGEPGDWRVLDDAGQERTVQDAQFRASHEPLHGNHWRRTGTFRAWRVGETLVLRTLEGRGIAHPGDWIVEGSHGERWPVSDRQFRRAYRAAGEPTAHAAGAARLRTDRHSRLAAAARLVRSARGADADGDVEGAEAGQDVAGVGGGHVGEDVTEVVPGAQ